MKYVLALADGTEVEVVEGQDVSDLLNIKRWVAPIPAELAGEIKGLFPSQIPKTDQERIQNLSAEFSEWKTENLTWEVTEKLEGSSMTVYVIDGEVGVCSRNLNLRGTKFLPFSFEDEQVEDKTV